MKRLISILTALVLCVSLLPGCGGPTASKRRKVAMDLFDITADEYKRNQEYYDALMDIYGSSGKSSAVGKDASVTGAEENNRSEPDYQTDSWADTWTDGQGDDAYAEEFVESDDPAVALRGQDAFELWELKSIYESSGGERIVAVKKGDTFYSPVLLEGKTFMRSMSFNSFSGFPDGPQPDGFVYAQGDVWEWPEVSLSEGDQIVSFKGPVERSDYGFVMASITDRVECLPLFLTGAFHKSGKAEDYIPKLWPDFTAKVEEESLEKNWDNFTFMTINGVPYKESPKLYRLAQYDCEVFYYGDPDEECYYVILGEPGETITIGGQTTDYYPKDVEMTYEVNCTVRLRSKNDAFGFDSDSKEVAYVFDDGMSVSVPERHIRPTDEGYSIIYSADTKRPPAGYYLLEGYPIRITD